MASVARPATSGWGVNQTGGTVALADRSRRPQRSPRRTPAPVQRAVLGLRSQHPAWGPRKLRRRLADLGRTDLPAPSTVAAILRREGCIGHDAAAGHRPCQRFERATPNELWQMDFKGHFALGRGGRCHPLTVLDDHSRFLVGLQACTDERGDTVRARLITLFRPLRFARGHPLRQRLALGQRHRRAHRLERLAAALGRARAPRKTAPPANPGQGRTFPPHLASRVARPSRLARCRARATTFNGYRDVYNLERPHAALDLAVPATRYQPSPRAYGETLPPLRYEPGELLRGVKSKGEITFRHRFFYIGRAFTGLPVALRPTTIEHCFTVCLGAHRLGRIDLTQPNDRPFGNCFPMLPLTPIIPS